MSESLKSPDLPAWEDITIEDINNLVLTNNISQALTLAKLRLGLIKKVSAEISFNNVGGEIPLENWQAVLRDFEAEVDQLQKLINFHE